jgi:flagellar basal-body rod protein FlgC
MPVDAIGTDRAATPSTAEVLQQSLALQRARVESAARRIAQANVPLPAGGASATPGAAFAQRVTAGEASAPLDAQTQGGHNAVRLALEPGHPVADANGIVRYPQVDLATEMTTMMSATRAYEASVRAYNLLKGMNGKAMEIGK